MSDKVYRNGETFYGTHHIRGTDTGYETVDFLFRGTDTGYETVDFLSNLLDEVWELGLASWPWRDAVRVSPDQAPMLAALGFGEPNE